MRKHVFFFAALLGAGAAFAQSNANDTQAAIVNSLLIQQLMNMQNQQQNQQLLQQQQQQALQNQQSPQASQQGIQQEEKKGRRSVESEDDLLDLGYKRFKFNDGAEDYIVIKNPKTSEYEVDVWAVNSCNRLAYYGTILVTGKKGYKGNPLDDDLDNYKSVWFKITNDEIAIIKNLGEKHSDQYFEIQ